MGREQYLRLFLAHHLHSHQWNRRTTVAQKGIMKLTPGGSAATGVVTRHQVGLSDWRWSLQPLKFMLVVEVFNKGFTIALQVKFVD